MIRRRTTTSDRNHADPGAANPRARPSGRRRTLGAVAAFTTLALGAGVVTPLAAQADPSWPVDQPASTANPVLGEDCDELDVTLLMDASGSVHTQGQVQTMKDAAWAMLHGLEGTSAEVSIVHFATGTTTYTTSQPVDSTTTSPGGSLYEAIEPYRATKGTSAGVEHPQYRFTPGDPANPLDPAQHTGPGNYAKDATNWQMALEAARATNPDLVILLTDGEPTAVHSSGTSNTGMTPDPFGDQAAILQLANNEEMLKYGFFKGVLAANSLKDAGARVMVVGVGSGNNYQSGALSRMQAIAGPTGGEAEAAVWFGEGPLDIDRVGVARVTEWSGLAKAMHQIALQVAQCAVPQVGNLTVAKAFDPGQSGFDGTFTVSVDCSATEHNRTLQLAGGQSATIEGIPAGTSCTVTELELPAAPPGWSWGDPVLDPADGVVTVGAGATATVTVTNRIDPQPAIDLVKEADVAGFDEAGDVITYTFTATNTGPVALSDVQIADPLPGLSVLTCEPGQPAVLAPGESMTCTASYRTTAQDLEGGLVQNTASVTGIDPRGTVVTDQDSADVPGQPRQGALADTGAGASAGVLAGSLLLLAIGATLVAASRRRTS